MELNLREILFRVILGIERAFIVVAIYYIMLALNPQTLVAAEAYILMSTEVLTAAVAALSFFSGFFKGTVFGSAADAARDLFLMTVFMLMPGEISLIVQEVHIMVDISLIKVMLMAACAFSFASTVISSVSSLAESSGKK